MRRFVHFVTAGTVNEWGEKMVRIPRKQKKRTPGHHSLYHHSLTTTSTLLPLALNYFLNKINLNLAVFLVFCHSCLSYVYVLYFAFCILHFCICWHYIYTVYIIPARNALRGGAGAPSDFGDTGGHQKYRRARDRKAQGVSIYSLSPHACGPGIIPG